MTGWLGGDDAASPREQIIHEGRRRLGQPSLHQAAEQTESNHGEEVIDQRRSPLSQQLAFQAPEECGEIVQ